MVLFSVVLDPEVVLVSVFAGLKVSVSVGLMSRFWSSDPSSDPTLGSGDS